MEVKIVESEDIALIAYKGNVLDDAVSVSVKNRNVSIFDSQGKKNIIGVLPENLVDLFLKMKEHHVVREDPKGIWSKQIQLIK